jgi:hypothetical protein
MWKLFRSAVGLRTGPTIEEILKAPPLVLYDGRALDGWKIIADTVLPGGRSRATVSQSTDGLVFEGEIVAPVAQTNKTSTRPFASCVLYFRPPIMMDLRVYNRLELDVIYDGAPYEVSINVNPDDSTELYKG